jgi:hypothetical protein
MKMKIISMCVKYSINAITMPVLVTSNTKWVVSVSLVMKKPGCVKLYWEKLLYTILSGY